MRFLCCFRLWELIDLYGFCSQEVDIDRFSEKKLILYILPPLKSRYKYVLETLPEVFV